MALVQFTVVMSLIFFLHHVFVIETIYILYYIRKFSLCVPTTACPNGTYASTNTSGDSTAACVSCPDANHITIKLPATSVVDCVCASGFITDGYKCEGNLLLVHS